jgi:nucleotide-binding universal stress UspA family protein
MTYATQLLYLGEERRLPTHVTLSACLARHFESHVIALSASGRPVVPPGAIAGAFGNAYSALGIEALRRAADARAQAFSAEARNRGLKDFEVVVADDDGSAALLSHARTADLVVIGQPDPGQDDWPRQRALLERAILGIAAPCLVVPYAGEFPDAGSRILVAWNDSRECSRAILAAMPFLQRASHVHLLQLEAPPDGGGALSSPRLDAAAQWLTRHGVKTRASVEPSEIDFGNALLSRAADLGADLVVAGAWSHSRLGESLFGGVTRTLLASVTVPLLTAH